ncbi:hypothetical protein C5S35_01880 [Candidatus Methanophagaceae archaeon]|nr:hypothetical protein C5S35_01880 [Methanophagales archaeon]
MSNVKIPMSNKFPNPNNQVGQRILKLSHWSFNWHSGLGIGHFFDCSRVSPGDDGRYAIIAKNFVISAKFYCHAAGIFVVACISCFDNGIDPSGMTKLYFYPLQKGR